MSLLREAQTIDIKSDFEAFDFVCRHLLAQAEKSYNEYGDCGYRGGSEEYPGDSNGKACAVGILIKDNFYSMDIEGNAVDYDEVQTALVQSNPHWNMTDRSLALLNSLQSLHDGYSVELWPAYMYYLSSFFVKEDFVNEDNDYELGGGRDFLNDYSVVGVDIESISLGSHYLDTVRIRETLDMMKGNK
jgi:hypothetical protein